MKRIVLTLSGIIFTFLCAFAQKEANNWYFGNNAGISFSTGSPVAFTGSAAVTYDNTSSISDSNGNIMFYTNGVTVWNKSNAVMSNGTGLLGSNTGGQCAIIVPEPKSSTIFYVFTVDYQAGPNGLNYSIVDMSQMSGMGAVTTKNVSLFTPSTEKLDAIYNQTDDSYWVITHTWNSSDFYVYKITSAGLNTTPVISNVGSVNGGGSYNAQGQMTLSKDGSKLASAVYSNGTIELFDFNMATGVVSNPLTITGFTNAWGTGFSPDGTKLYTEHWFTDSIYQFDLTSNNISTIMASATIVGHAPGTGGYNAGYFQLGPDDKIYVARYGIGYIGVINNPDSLGTKCDFVSNGVYLGTGIVGQVGLSRVPVKRIVSTEGINDIKSNYRISIYPNPNNGNFCVELNNNRNLNRIELYNQLGQMIYSGKLVSGKNQIALHGKSEGIYLYKIISDKNTVVKTGEISIE